MNCLCFLPRLTISVLDTIPLVLLRTSRPFSYNFHPNFALLTSPSLLGHVHQNTNMVKYLPSCKKKKKNAPGIHIPITLVFFGIVKVKIAQSCPIFCNPTDYTVHGIFQARTLEWVAVPFSSRSSQPRNEPRYEPRSPTLQADFLPAEPPEKPFFGKKKKPPPKNFNINHFTSSHSNIFSFLSIISITSIAKSIFNPDLICFFF